MYSFANFITMQTIYIAILGRFEPWSMFVVPYFNISIWNCFTSLRNRWPEQILAILFRPFRFYCSQNFKLFGFPIFRFWAYLMKVIPEMRRAHYIWYLCFYCIVFVFVFKFRMVFQISAMFFRDKTHLCVHQFSLV